MDTCSWCEGHVFTCAPPVACFPPVFGQPPSVGRWCWCPFLMGFKSSPISCQLPHADLQDRRQTRPRGAAIARSSSHTPLRSTLLSHVLCRSLLRSFCFDFFDLSFIPSRLAAQAPSWTSHCPLVLSYFHIQSICGRFAPAVPLRPHPPCV